MRFRQKYSWYFIITIYFTTCTKKKHSRENIRGNYQWNHHNTYHVDLCQWHSLSQRIFRSTYKRYSRPYAPLLKIFSILFMGRRMAISHCIRINYMFTYFFSKQRRKSTRSADVLLGLVSRTFSSTWLFYQSELLFRDIMHGQEIHEICSWAYILRVSTLRHHSRRN